MAALSPSEARGAGSLLRTVAQVQIFCRATSATIAGNARGDINMFAGYSAIMGPMLFSLGS
jgi:hypothetical protein